MRQTSKKAGCFVNLVTLTGFFEVLIEGEFVYPFAKGSDNLFGLIAA
ncbi:MAG: hypothetical protein ACQEWH_09300 [Bacillota bacterium]